MEPGKVAVEITAIQVVPRLESRPEAEDASGRFCLCSNSTSERSYKPPGQVLLPGKESAKEKTNGHCRCKRDLQKQRTVSR